MSMKTLGSEAARAKLPELLELAHHGSPTVITKHGRPYAALMPISAMNASRRPISVLSLEGTGAGLWGEDSVRAVAQLRDEWE
jgi:prevent-host-death family protein